MCISLECWCELMGMINIVVNYGVGCEIDKDACGSSDGGLCQNGATCQYTREGFKCQCPFGMSLILYDTSVWL